MPDNVGLVKHVLDAVNRADVDAVLESFCDDFEFDFSNSRGPLSGVYQGRDGARDFLTSFFEPWASLEFEPEEIIELEGGRMLTVTPFRARGHESGIDVAAKGATVWTLRDGKVAGLTFYQSKDEALEAIN
jgi:ketosteroid isomerase-like protein